MKIAITGGTGFVGRHLARALAAEGHNLVLIARGMDRRDLSILNSPRMSFMTSDLSSAEELRVAFSGCEAIAHCAGINREVRDQTYARVHVTGTENVVKAALLARVRKVV